MKILQNTVDTLIPRRGVCQLVEPAGPADLAVAGTELQLRQLVARQLDPGQLTVSPDLATLHTFLTCFDMP